MASRTAVATPMQIRLIGSFKLPVLHYPRNRTNGVHLPTRCVSSVVDSAFIHPSRQTDRQCVRAWHSLLVLRLIVAASAGKSKWTLAHISGEVASLWPCDFATPLRRFD